MFSNRRVRDNMDDKNVQTIIKEVDAWAFAMGVFLTMLVEYLALSKPEYLAPFTYSLMPILLIHRYIKAFIIKNRVSVQGVKSLGGHFACL